MLRALLLIYLGIISQITYSKCPSYTEIRKQIGAELDDYINELYTMASNRNKLNLNYDLQRGIMTYDPELSLIKYNSVKYYVSSISMKSKLNENSDYSYALIDNVHPLFALTANNIDVYDVKFTFARTQLTSVGSCLNYNLCTYSLNSEGTIYGLIKNSSNPDITKNGISFIIKIILRTKQN